MNITDYPYVIIIIFAMVLAVVAFFGVFFARKGLKVAGEDEGADFTNIAKLESAFERLGRHRQKRCLIYVSVSLDNVRSLYSDAKAVQIYSQIRSLLLRFFDNEGVCCIAPYDNQNFVAMGSFDADYAAKNVKNCLYEISRCFLKHKAINKGDVVFGIYSGIASDVSFNDAINRAKQASVLADSREENYAEWTSGDGRALEQRIKIENNIENEIDNNKFFLEYQPVLDALSGKIIGAEVLSRLNSETDGVLTPGSFLDAVNSVGVTKKFDYYIFEKTCKWIANNKKERRNYMFTINFSRSTISDGDFVNNFVAIVERYRLDYTSFAVEVLEDGSVTSDERKIMKSNISVLKDKGVSILLDDFGSGYTTFADLHGLAITAVKIDKSLLHSAGDDAEFLILKNVVRTAKELGFKIICEGIETKEHERLAKEAGCDMFQGYYYYRPMPVAKFEKLLEEDK